MRPQILLLAGLSFLLLAVEAHAQTSRYSPEMSRIRWALAALVALLLFLSIRRGAPVPGSRRWFWNASPDELGPDLARLRERALLHGLAGAGLLVAGVLTGGYAVGDALVEAFERDGRWIDHLPGQRVLLTGVFLALGIALLARGIRMAPNDLPDRSDGT